MRHLPSAPQAWSRCRGVRGPALGIFLPSSNLKSQQGGIMPLSSRLTNPQVTSRSAKARESCLRTSMSYRHTAVFTVIFRIHTLHLGQVFRPPGFQRRPVTSSSSGGVEMQRESSLRMVCALFIRSQRSALSEARQGLERWGGDT